jgi:hypothetical protein
LDQSEAGGEELVEFDKVRSELRLFVFLNNTESCTLFSPSVCASSNKRILVSVCVSWP